MDAEIGRGAFNAPWKVNVYQPVGVQWSLSGLMRTTVSGCYMESMPRISRRNQGVVQVHHQLEKMSGGHPLESLE